MKWTGDLNEKLGISATQVRRYDSLNSIGTGTKCMTAAVIASSETGFFQACVALVLKEPIKEWEHRVMLQSIVLPIHCQLQPFADFSRSAPKGRALFYSCSRFRCDWRLAKRSMVRWLHHPSGHHPWTRGGLCSVFVGPQWELCILGNTRCQYRHPQSVLGGSSGTAGRTVQRSRFEGAWWHGWRPEVGHVKPRAQSVVS